MRETLGELHKSSQEIMIEWINKIFGISNDISVPTLISIIVFIVGGLAKFIFEIIDNLIQRKIIRKTLITLLEEVIKDLKIKEKNLNAFHSTVVITSAGSWLLAHRTVSYLETIYELDFKETYYSFRKKFFLEFLHKENQK